MRRQRNLHLLPSCTRVKLSSVVVTSKSVPSTSRNFGVTSSKPRTGRAFAPSCSSSASSGQTSRGFQTQSSFTSRRRHEDSGEHTVRDNDGSSRDTTNGNGTRRYQMGKNSSNRREFSGKEAAQEVTDRTIMLTPWRGTPTLLHALGFLRELEDKYGKIWWAGLSKDKANPYEYNTGIIVVFEDVASLSRIPGFNAFAPQPEQSTIAEAVEIHSSSNPGIVDLGPSTKLDPLSNSDSQALLKRVDTKQNTSPLFVPWSESLNAAANRKGGPSMEDVLPFLASKQARDHIANAIVEEEASKDSEKPSTELTKGESSVPTTFKKASWDEWDEPVNIDAVVRKYGNDKLFLPSPSSISMPYFKQHVRVSVARAMIDFAGFSETPVPSMQNTVNAWRKELEEREQNVWTPWSESALDSVMEGQQDQSDVVKPQDIEEDLPWDEFAPGVWPIVNAASSEELLRDGEELVPRKLEYERIAVDDGIESVEDWEGVGSQLREDAEPTSTVNSTDTIRSRLASLPQELERMAEASSSTNSANDVSTPPDTEKSNANVLPQDPSTKTGTLSRNPKDLRDPWRTDPRPFRSGLGRDQPPSPYAEASSAPSKRAQWSKPGLDSMSPGTRERGAMAKGSHSSKSEGWERDKRGKKLRSREEVEALKEFGLGHLDDLAAEKMERLQSARARGELGSRETWQSRRQQDDGGKRLEESAARISARAGKEQRIKEVKNLKDRLRAILDGTNVD